MSTPVYPLRKSGFLVHLKVGKHKADQYLFLDTGSSLLWIHCQPGGLNARNPGYDSKESSTYQAEDCRTSAFCDAYNFKRDLFQRCRYIQSYADGIKSKGHLARETFVFGGKDGYLFGRNEVVLPGRYGLAEFPIVRFWFGKISYMEFRTGHLFRQMGNGIFCLAFKPSEHVTENFDFGIMGILVQKGYYISYNLQASTFSFESMDCSAFDNDIHDEL